MEQSGPRRASAMFTSGLTGYTSMSAWETSVHACLLLLEPTPDGRKELVGLLDGERESRLSWKELLLDIKQRGLDVAPKVATADGGLGFWAALEEVYPSTLQQRCWVHKTANVLNKLQGSAKERLRGIYTAPSRKDA